MSKPLPESCPGDEHRDRLKKSMPVLRSRIRGMDLALKELTNEIAAEPDPQKLQKAAAALKSAADLFDSDEANEVTETVALLVEAFRVA